MKCMYYFLHDLIEDPLNRVHGFDLHRKIWSVSESFLKCIVTFIE